MERSRSPEQINLSETRNRLNTAIIGMRVAIGQLGEAQAMVDHTKEYFAYELEDAVGTTVNVLGRPAVHRHVFTIEGGHRTMSTTPVYRITDRVKEPRQYTEATIIGIEENPLQKGEHCLALGDEESYDLIPLRSVYEFEIVEPQAEQ